MPQEVHDCYYLGSGYVNSVAAEWTAAEPNARRRFINRGECGDQLRQLLARVDADCIAHAPDLVSILVGVNDAGDGIPADIFRDSYRALLDRLRSQLPHAKLLLLEPFGLAVPPVPGIETISRRQLDHLALLQPIVGEVAEQMGATFVPLQASFDHAAATAPAEVWALDGIHPSAAGHWLIARAWTAAARQAGWLKVTAAQRGAANAPMSAGPPSLFLG